MVNDYERQDFWKKRVKITKCENKDSWYHDKVGEIFDVDSISVRDYYIKENGDLKCILVVDAEIIL